MSLTADLLRGYTDSIILRQLETGDSYGYGINKLVKEQSAGNLQLKEATLYTAFRRLQSSGLIQSYWGDEGSGARRRYYAITPLGREKLAADRLAWQQTRLLLDSLLGIDLEQKE